MAALTAGAVTLYACAVGCAALADDDTATGSVEPYTEIGASLMFGAGIFALAALAVSRCVAATRPAFERDIPRWPHDDAGLATIQARIDGAARRSEIGVLLLDRMDVVVACLGIGAANQLLAQIAARLGKLADVYRIDGDKLALWPRGSTATADFSWDAIADRLRDFDVHHAGHRIRLHPYIGVARCVAGVGVEELVSRACDAAYRSRAGAILLTRADAARVRDERAARRAALGHDSRLLRCLRHGGLELYLQPIARLDGRAARGMAGEVLARLRDDDGRLLEPAAFLPVLAESRTVGQLDLAVLQALAQWLVSNRANLAPIEWLSVNLGGQTLASRAHTQQMLRLLDVFPLPPSALCFEISETATLRTPHERQFLAQLRERGCHVAVDDFGVGRQTFDRLKRVPFDLLKLDGTLIRNFAFSPYDRELVRAAVTAGKAFGAEIVAEYVADAGTAMKLRALGVAWAQGDLHGSPAPIATYLRRSSCNVALAR